MLQALPDVQFNILSGTPVAEYNAIGLRGPNIHLTKVAYHEVTNTLRQQDILVFPHGFEGNWPAVEYQTIFPTRTIPYLLSGVPIVAHCPPDCFLAKWLRANECAELVTTRSVEDLAAAVTRLRNDPVRRRLLATNALLAVRKFYAPMVAREMRRIVNAAEPASE